MGRFCSGVRLHDPVVGSALYPPILTRISQQHLYVCRHRRGFSGGTCPRVFSGDSSTPPFHSIQFAHGERIAGNVPSCTTQVGWLDVPAEELGFDNDESYRFYTSKIGDYLLSTGRSVRELDEMRNYSYTSFLLTFLASIILALVGSLILARRSYSRVRSIVSSMESVAQGDMDARRQ